MSGKRVLKTFLVVTLTAVVSSGISEVYAELEFTAPKRSITVAPEDKAEFPLYVKNTGSTAVVIYGLKNHIEPFPEGWFSQMCIGKKCYRKHIEKSRALPLNPGDTVTFKLDIQTDSIINTASVLFSVQDTLSEEILWKDTFTCTSDQSSIRNNYGQQQNRIGNITVHAKGSGNIIENTIPYDDKLSTLHLFNLNGRAVSTIPFSA